MSLSVQTNIALKWEITLTRIALKLGKTFTTELQIANMKTNIKIYKLRWIVDVCIIFYSNFTREVGIELMYLKKMFKNNI